MGVARAAFPSYSFEVSKAGGLRIAVPIQGLPTGLGIMGAREAVGSVTIRDAYTYGVSTEAALTQLDSWWRSKEVIRNTLADVSRQVEEPIYLRIITRVYLTGGVTVSLTNKSASGGGLDVGDAPELEMIDLAAEDPEKAQAAGNVKHDLPSPPNMTYPPLPH